MRESKPNVARIWSFLWRGALGGVLGLILLFVYRLYTNLYLLGGFFPVGVFVAAVDGLLVGAFIFYLGRLLGRNIGVALRVLAGTCLSFCSIAIYSYLDGAFLYNDAKAFIGNSVLVGFMFGGPAGALARGESRKDFSKENHDGQSAATDRKVPWGFLWRGTVGGVLGLFILIAYLFFFDTYRLNGLKVIALIAAGNGLAIGALIFFLTQALRRDLGIVVRITAGLLFSLCSTGFVSYVAGGFYGDLKWFVSNVILLAITLGGPPSFLAKEKPSKTT